MLDKFRQMIREALPIVEADFRKGGHKPGAPEEIRARIVRGLSEDASPIQIEDSLLDCLPFVSGGLRKRIENAIRSGELFR